MKQTLPQAQVTADPGLVLLPNFLNKYYQAYFKLWPNSSQNRKYVKRHITAVSKLYSALSTTSTSTTIRVAIFISLGRFNKVVSALLKSVSQRVSDKARQWSNSGGKIAKKAFLGKRNPDHLLISDLLPKRQQSSSDVFSAYNTVSIETKMSNKLWFSYLSWSMMAKTSPTSSLAFLSSNTLTVGLRTFVLA